MDVFEAIAEPNRRMMLDLLRQEDRSAGELVRAFPSLTQPAVSRHLRVLRETGLVQVRSQAQQRIYALSPEGWSELDAWISKYQNFWELRLDRLSRHLDRRAAKMERQKNQGVKG